MKNIEGQLESLEEVIQQLIEKATAIENEIKYLHDDVCNMDYSAEFLTLKQQIKVIGDGFNQHGIMNQLLFLEKRVKVISNVNPLNHQSNYKPKYNAIYISAIMLFLISAFSFGFALYSWQSQLLLKADSIKYRMISQLYPKVSFWADTAYQRDVKKAKSWVDQLEQAQLELIKLERIYNKQEKVLINRKRNIDSLRMLYNANE